MGVRDINWNFEFHCVARTRKPKYPMNFGIFGSDKKSFTDLCHDKYQLNKENNGTE